jgi:hypothetical protein
MLFEAGQRDSCEQTLHHGAFQGLWCGGIINKSEHVQDSC